ncbi:uncharacterized protein EDB91DRAFT_1101566 [Suillus paluster]|uniref:uncharacterized protein n=1 Tax=Suillus paluster TaxID=48578 RepID=UPI001B878EE6|nr:uncharacterized protein EDB91DRAFT_1101566 [Suillus paluster]KAG1752286.1 hypothetical protein EDB91DRAFT_1101566 [Suillus paluster]
MGSILSHTSFEWAVAAGIAGAAAYGYLTYSNSGAPGSISEHATTGGKSAKAKKKKQTPKNAGVSEPSEKPVSTTISATSATTATVTSAQGVSVPEPTIVPFPHVIPGEFNAVQPSSDDQGFEAKKDKTKKKQKKKQKQKETGAVPDVASERRTSQSGGDTPGTSFDIPSGMSSPKEEEKLRSSQIRSSSPSFDTDSSWTRIDTRQRTARGVKTTAASVLAITTDMTSSDVGPSTGDSSVAEAASASADAGTRGDNRRTLAEKLLPKPRKTAVDDMLERPDYPGLARVMRVHPRADEAPAPGFSWKDYEDVDDGSNTLNDADGEGEGEWGIVKGKGRSKTSRPPTTSSQSVQKAPEGGLTQKQRQNARRNQLVKAAKADAEAERQANLTERQRAREREQIIDQSHRGGGKQTSGGMQAFVNSRGKLVYD